MKKINLQMDICSNARVQYVHDSKLCVSARRVYMFIAHFSSMGNDCVCACARVLAFPHVPYIGPGVYYCMHIGVSGVLCVCVCVARSRIRGQPPPHTQRQYTHIQLKTCHTRVRTRAWSSRSPDALPLHLAAIKASS